MHKHYGLKHECCGLWSWGGKPLVGRATHRARQAAHAALDILYDNGWERDDVYTWLAGELGLPEPDTRMSLMDAVTAQSVVGIVDRALATWHRRKEADR